MRLQSGTDWLSSRPDVKEAVVPVICIPTTLSGGEYQALAGGTNDETHAKHGFAHGTVPPALVVLDSALTTTTPDKFWLSTGIRAVDHCVETICSIKEDKKGGEEAAEEGLKKLVPGLLRCKRDANDLDARHLCQLGVIDSLQAIKRVQDLGASHGIGHQLGPLGVGHGETSCILLPAVCKYNIGVNREQQERAASILWGQPDVKEVLGRRGVKQGEDELGNVLDVIVRELGMPRSLKEVGVGSDKLDKLAGHALEDKWCRTNPVPLTEKSQVLEILEMVVG
jgi:alcohol dehydrogenase class IV